MPALSRKYISSLFRAGDRAATTTAKGARLVALTRYIVGRVPGISLHATSVRTTAGSQEIDVVFWNDRLANGFPFLPELLLFECKNWDDPVGAPDVAYFLAKLAERHLQYGFLVASNGITGDAHSRTAAYSHIDTHFIQHNRRLLMLDRTELTALSDTMEFVNLVKRKISKIVLRTYDV